MSASRQLHLSVGINSTGYFNASWQQRTGARLDFADPAYYLRLARLAHQGRLDALFLSDHPALMQDTRVRPLHSLDPLILLTALAAQVPDIGLVATVSSSYNSPYNLARRAQSLDVLSGGRLAVNIVSSFSELVAANFGSAPLPPRDERYRRAHEFTEVVRALWGSWDFAREGEVPPGHLWGASAARAIRHRSEFFSVDGPLNVPRSPQGQPVIAQAGASAQGLELAARHGELVYCSLLSKPAAAEFGQRLRARAEALGRRPQDLRITPGLVPIVADSRQAALRRHEQLTGAGSEDELLRRFAAEHGLDLARIDPDAPLDPQGFQPALDQRRPIGFTQAVADLVRHERVSAREAVRRSEQGHRLLLGTPEDIADGIVDWWQEGLVDGYTLQVPALPDDLECFVREVVPLLQRRGVFRTEYAETTLRERLGLPGWAGRRMRRVSGGPRRAGD